MDVAGIYHPEAPPGKTAGPRYQPLVALALAVFAGIVLDRYGRPPLARVIGELPLSWFGVWWCLSAGCLAAWRVTAGRRAAVGWLLAAGGLAAAAWHDCRWYYFPAGEIARFASLEPEPACLEVVVRDGPARVPAPRPTPLRAIPGVERSRLTVDVVAVRDGRSWRPASGRLRVLVSGHLLGVGVGDRLRVFGQLARQSGPRNPGEPDFAAYARADRELATLRSTSPDSVSVVGAGGWSWRRALASVRQESHRLVGRHVGWERTRLASAILLGARHGLPREETTAYMRTGTVHVLVVSGMNLVILGTGLRWLMRLGWLGRRTGLAVIGAAVVGYAVLAEAQPPIVRAAIVAVLMCLAAWTGRHGVAFNTLAAAALGVLAINPAELFRTGTQLSFLCVATLIWVGQWSADRQGRTDRLEELLAAARPWPQRWLAAGGKWAGWLVATSLAVWLCALPLVLYQFHVVTPITWLISPMVWVLIFAALWSGFGMLVFGALWPLAGDLFGGVCDRSLAGLEGVVNWSEALPASHFWSPGPAWWWVLGFYAAWAAIVYGGQAWLPRRWQAGLLAGWMLAGLVPSLWQAATRNEAEVAFLAVGHGSCVVLRAPSGETLLYDAGSLGSPDFATETIAAYLWHRGIRRIDGLVLSHADIDHYNAVPGLLERFHVSTIFVSPVMFASYGPAGASEGPQVLREAIERAGVPIRETWAGDRLRIGEEMVAEVLHPPRRGVIGSDNANSVTLAVEYRGRRLLLPGDLESPGLEDLMAERPHDCDVLLAPHHGSRRSDPPGFAAWSTPEVVVISGGGRAAEMEPVVRTYEAAGARVWQTYDSGTVEIVLDGRPLQPTPFRPRGL